MPRSEVQFSSVQSTIHDTIIYHINLPACLNAIMKYERNDYVYRDRSDRIYLTLKYNIIGECSADRVFKLKLLK
jgi:hypothetical protein